jgi:hypothetical protein
MNTKLNWHIVYTKPNCEKKVTQLLTQRGIENYCPYYTTTVKWQNRDTLTRKPLFDNYVFVRTTESELSSIKKLPQVINILYKMNEIAVVQSEEMQTIKHILRSYKQIDLVKTGFNPGETFSDIAEEKAVFTIPSLGYSLLAAGKVEEVRTLKPVWTDRTDAKLAKNLLDLKNIQGMFTRFPSFLKGRSIGVEESLTQELERQ